ncbi:MAG: NINE protein [Chitinophagaceae bacterium]
MDKKTVKIFYKENKLRFSRSKRKKVYRMLLSADEETFNTIEKEGFDDPTILLVASIFVGYLGIGRFMLGDILIGAIKLFITLIAVLLWYILVIRYSYSDTLFYLISIITGFVILFNWSLDIFNIFKKTKQHNFEVLKEMIQKK